MTEIRTDIDHLKEVLSKALAHEWEAQGHKMSGKIVDTIDYVVKQEADRMTISGMMYPYGMYIAAGVKSSNIPYGGRTGRGGTSLYIKALQDYVKARMNITDEQKSKSIAFAIAQTQKNSGDYWGMPTRGSYAYSSTGKRLGWIEDAFKNNEEEIIGVVREMCFDLLSLKFDVMLTEWNATLKKN
jgi:hypothetical protein